MPGTCTIIFRNATPCDWRVRIIEIGAKFWYQDENGNIVRDWWTNKGTTIDCNQEDSLTSDDSNACVRQVLMVSKVYVSGQGERLFQQSKDGGPKHCILRTGAVLAPKISGASVHLDVTKALQEFPISLIGEDEYATSLETNKFFQTSSNAKK